MIGASGGLEWSENRSASLRHADLESLQDFETTEQSMDQSCCGMFGRGNRYAGLPAGILDWLMDSQQAVQYLHTEAVVIWNGGGSVLVV